MIDKLRKKGRPKFIDELNREFGLIVAGNTLRIIWFQPDGSFKLISLADFKVLLANRQIGDLRGEKLAEAWIAHQDRRQYRGFTFDPSNNHDPTLFNLWRGYAVEPKFENARPGLEFISEVICNDDLELFLWVLAWIAQAVQEPHKKPGTAIILLGPGGIGKSTFAEMLKRLFGPHAETVNSANRLTTNFNYHLKDKCLVIVEEAPLLRRHANVLKDLITNPRMMVEPKGVDAFEVDNHIRMIVCTNELHALYAQAHERRYCVIRVSDKYQEDEGYFVALYDWMDADGIAALLRFLQEYDYSRVNLRKVPRTKALLEQKQSSFSPVEHFVWDALQSGYWPNGQPWHSPINRDWLLQEINDSPWHTGQRVNPTQLGQQLKAIFPDLESPRPAAGGKRPRMYKFPSLEEARQRFSEYVRQPLEWDSLEELHLGPKLDGRE
jgi:hypothetical protein